MEIKNSSTEKSIFNFRAGNMAQLPHMPYKTNQFDLVLCDDCIFHCSLSADNIAIIIKELCRIATEVHIFPLLNDQRKMSETLGPLMLILQKNNYGVEMREMSMSPKNNNALLRIWEQECKL